MNGQLDIVVFDFETSGVNPQNCHPLQLAAIVVDGRTMEIKKGHEFQSYIRPETDNLEEFCKTYKEALDINHITASQLEIAPIESVVWKSFCDFVNQYNFRKNSFNAPIFCGYNIIGFDLPIVDRLCQLYGPTDKKDGRQSLYNRRFQLDVMQLCYLWFETLDLPNYKLSTIMDFLGIKKDGTEHNAITDVKNTAAIMLRFMKMHRNICGDGSKFRGAFAK